MSDMLGIVHYREPLDARPHRCIFEEDGVQCTERFDRGRTRRKYCKLHGEVMRYEQTKARWKRQYQERKAAFAIEPKPDEQTPPIGVSVALLDERYPHLQIANRETFGRPGWKPTITWEQFKRMFGLEVTA